METICVAYAAAFGGIQNFGKQGLHYALKGLAPSLYKNEEQGTKVANQIIDSYFENVDETDSKQNIQAKTNVIKYNYCSRDCVFYIYRKRS